jgi:hypothetical protein
MRAEPVSWLGHLAFNIRQRFGIDQGPGVMGLVRRPEGKQLELITDRAKWLVD